MLTFKIGRPPLYQFFHDDNWKSFKTLEKRQMLLSLGIGISLGICIAAIWKIYFDSSLPFGSPTWAEFLFAAVALTIGHEMLHLLGFPYFGFDSNTVVGIWPEAGSPYVQYMSPMSRNRFLVVSILPFLAFSAFPFFLAYNNAAPLDFLSWISVLNCVGAGSDIFIFVQVLRTVPSKCRVIESDNSLFWQEYTA